MRLTEIQSLLDWCDFPMGGTWLEVGAGLGLLAWVLAPLSDRMIATDLYDLPDKQTHTPGLERARRFLRAVGDTQVEIVKADSTNLSIFPDHSIRVVVNAWVLEHVPDRDLALREFRRVLEPGGVCLSVVPNFMGEVTQPASTTLRFMVEMGKLVLIPFLRPNTFRRLATGQDGTRSAFLYTRRFWNSNIKSISGFFRPHGEYPSAFAEFRANLPYVWIKKFEAAGFQVTDFFSPMLFPFHLFYGFSPLWSARWARLSFPLWRPFTHVPGMRWLGTGIAIRTILPRGG
jgi:ubiquinone/menaquinone biosynthesis C-methylase UbiE